MFLILFLFWIILNGRIGTELTVVGLIATTVLFVVSRYHLHYTLAREIRLLRKLPLFCLYLGRLLMEMTLSTLHVMRYVYSTKYEPEPVIVEFDGKFATRVGMTLMANYITLTPGTITVDVEKNHFIIHCLDEEFAPDPEGPMAEIILRMERE